MGIMISRYVEPGSNEGAIMKFIIDSMRLVKAMCTSDSYFPDLTPWNVIRFGEENESAAEYEWNEDNENIVWLGADEESGRQCNGSVVIDGMEMERGWNEEKEASVIGEHNDEWRKYDLLYFGREYGVDMNIESA